MKVIDNEQRIIDALLEAPKINNADLAQTVFMSKIPTWGFSLES